MLIIDPATGAMYKIETEFLNETLLPAKTTASNELRVYNIGEIPSEWKKHLVSLK